MSDGKGKVKVTGTLRNARRVPVGADPRAPCLSGEIYGDARGRFFDGERIRTSTIMAEEGDVFTTRFSVYRVESWAENAANDNFDLVAHLGRQRDFSLKTFGPGARTSGVVDHIRKELAEIEAAPEDVEEWVDVIILAFDGAWRAGWEPKDIVKAIVAKQVKNEGRTWPDWRAADPSKAIEHVRVAA